MEQEIKHEITQLMKNMGKMIRITLIQNSKSRFSTNELIGKLYNVVPFAYIDLSQEGHIEPIAFIGMDLGITTITVLDSNQIIYQNNDLNYPEQLTREKAIEHMNTLREQKFHTQKYNN